MAGAADLKEDLALVFELDFLVVKLAGQHHDAVHGEKIGFVQTARLNRRLGRWTRGVGSRVAAVDDRRFHPRKL